MNLVLWLADFKNEANGLAENYASIRQCEPINPWEFYKWFCNKLCLKSTSYPKNFYLRFNQQFLIPLDVRNDRRSDLHALIFKYLIAKIIISKNLIIDLTSTRQLTSRILWTSPPGLNHCKPTITKSTQNSGHQVPQSMNIKGSQPVAKPVSPDGCDTLIKDTGKFLAMVTW